MEQINEKLDAWYNDESELLDIKAHDVAQADDVDEMLKAKSLYDVQSAKVETIREAIKLVNEQK
ncbi:hypothetical protein [Psychrobacillus sp. FSL K6-1267]|uniref:hypothetical protein n=1 Tax=Psychrobacillus sp. FSL K6-1267 TaxID=2921543 RepID=UPI0030F51647